MRLAGRVRSGGFGGRYHRQVDRAGPRPQRRTGDYLKVDGSKLTGSMTGRQGDVEISDGKISGDEISFSVTMGQGKAVFKGKITGAEIKFTREREGGEPQQFVAKRMPT